MIKVGMKDANPGAKALVDLTAPGPHGQLPVMPMGKRPVQLPRLPEGHRLFAGYDQGAGEMLILIETLEDAQQLWDSYAVGGALWPPTWYSAPALFTGDN